VAGKGQPKTGGRQVGTPNKHGKALKEMVFGALEAKDGQAWLEKQMDKNPVAFMTLLGKFVPTTLAGDPEAPVVHKIERVIVRSNAENPNG
jgi:hypothetical protein